MGVETGAELDSDLLKSLIKATSLGPLQGDMGASPLQQARGSAFSMLEARGIDPNAPAGPAEPEAAIGTLIKPSTMGMS
jgi:hypothetical protein